MFIIIGVEPNLDISEAVNRAIAKYTERVDQQIEIVENGFKSINDEIERRILNASQTLDESLNVIDKTLAGLLDDRKSVSVIEQKRNITLWLQTIVRSYIIVL